MAQVLRGLDRAHYLGQVGVSPDGKRLAWIQGSRGGTEIRVAPLEDLSKFVRITAAASADQHCREGEFNWAPDSSQLVFLSDCATSDEQIYLAGASGSPVRRISELRGDVGAPAFSPDGKAIAFLYVEGTTRPVGALAAQELPSGVIGESKSDIQRVALVPADASQPLEPKFITPPNLHVYEFDWAPDSQSLAYIAADPPGENNWWIARLYSQQTGGEPRVVLDPQQVPGELHDMQMAVPRWSPDGKAIAFIGGLMSDLGVTGGDIWIVPAAGGKPLNLTPQRPSSPAWITWGGTHWLYASELAGGDSRLIRLDLAGSLASPDLTVSSTAIVFSLSGNIGDNRMEKSLSSTADRSLFVFRASSFSAPPEIFAARTAVPAGGHEAGFPPISQISHINEGVQPAWGKAASVNWTNEGFHVQGWLLYPKDYDASKKYPLIVEVHGGPASAVVSSWGAGWGLSPAAFSALGYFVLQPNPRGSYGQGEAFTKANRKDFGYGDLRDILAGVDAVLAKYPVDPDRIGLTGWSYGGFMTMFAVTQTHRFRAAVAGAGISDWLSYYGENSIDQWMIPYFGASVYDDPGVYAKSSAINFIKQVKTPTLVVVGDRDGECPAPQSFEFWHALQDLHASTELVVYPNEGHDFADPAHRRDVMERAVDWFAKYMPAER
jgi:dipeptidyl aminopeptidase/acylaminoacyl peptidase